MSRDRKKAPTDTRPTRRDFIKKSALIGAGVGAGAVVVGVSGKFAKAHDTDPNDEPRIFPDQANSEVRWGFFIDLRACTGCMACAIACKTENSVRLGTFRSGVITDDQGTYPNTERHWVPWLCNHCKNPPCLAGCPVEAERAELTMPGGEVVEYWARAAYQRPDGLVLVDQERCIGCGACVGLCPYEARYLDRVKPAGGNSSSFAADKCTLCNHRLENGVVPACVNTCKSEARIVGNLNDPNSVINARIAAAGASVSSLLESAGSEPQVFYVNVSETAYTDGDEPRREAGLQTVIS